MLHSEHAINELAAAAFHDLVTIPVGIDSEFSYPDESFFESLQAGQALNFEGENGAHQLAMIEDLVRSVFNETSVGLDANGSARGIDLTMDILTKRYRACIHTITAGHVGPRLVQQGPVPGRLSFNCLGPESTE